MKIPVSFTVGVHVCSQQGMLSHPHPIDTWSHLWYIQGSVFVGMLTPPWHLIYLWYMQGSMFVGMITLPRHLIRPLVCQEVWLIIYCCTSRSRIFHLYGDVTIAGEGLQNWGLCSAFRVIEQGGIFIVPHRLWHRTSVFPVSSEGPPQTVASYDADANPDPHGHQEVCVCRDAYSF
jgi:hypothetical protein